MKYPIRCKIIDVNGHDVFPGIAGRTPDISKPHIGKVGLAEDLPQGIRITLDDETILWGYECWWVPKEEVKQLEKEVILCDTSKS